jgi:hypothetical protein
LAYDGIKWLQTVSSRLRQSGRDIGTLKEILNHPDMSSPRRCVDMCLTEAPRSARPNRVNDSCRTVVCRPANMASSLSN